MKEIKYRKTGKTQLKKLIAFTRQIMDIQESEICDRQGCKNEVAGHVLLRFGAIGLCAEHLDEHRKTNPIYDDYNPRPT